MKFVDTAPIAGTRRTADGYLVAEVRCARTGCQDYLAREVGLNRDGIVTVYRPEAAVFDRASLATFAGKPVTLTHPDEPVTADNWRRYAVGDVGADIARDGEFVRVPIKLMDADAIRAVEGGVREISMGYETPLRHEDGVAPDGTPYQAVQTGPIRINHLALVPRARGGSELRIGDGAEWGVAPIIMEDKSRKDQSMTLKTVTVDGIPVEVTDQGAAVIATLQQRLADATTKTTEASAAHAAAIAAKDADIARRDAQIDDLKAKVLDDAAIDARVQARADLIAGAGRIVAGFKTAGLSDADIRKAVVVAKLGDAAIAGKSAEYIDARFDILAEDAQAADPVRAALLSKDHGVTADAWPDAVFAAAGVSIRKEA